MAHKRMVFVSEVRNKSILDLLCHFDNDHGCKAAWHYFESGHGKSACDGVGGTAKRNADMAVKQSKVVIQDANDFFAGAVTSQSEIEYQLITQEEYKQCNAQIELRNNIFRPVKGTMLLHAIATQVEGTDIIFIMRETTCVCKHCFDEKGFNTDSSCKWDKASLKKVEARNSELNTCGSGESEHVESRNDREEGQLQIHVSDFIVAEYDSKRYIGQVIEIDIEDESLHVKFMTASGKSVQRLKWLSKPDQIWIERLHVCRKIEPPKATGKLGKIFEVQEEVIRFMELNS